MAVMKTHISWTNSTWNPTTGCTKVSRGCDFCYAEEITNRLWGGNFDTVKCHPKRLKQVHGFEPITQQNGLRVPRMVFVNSMSDLMHKDIPDDFRNQVFELMEAKPQTVFQILTKRPMTMRRYLEGRYGQGGPRQGPIPENLWFGASVEDNRVKQRIDILRQIKLSLGPYTAFLSVEPLIGPCDEHDYARIDWVLIGGESGPHARPMEIAWPRTARDRARAAGCRIWFKQFGTWPNNPLYQRAPGSRHIDKVNYAIAHGERRAGIVEKNGRPAVTGEKGGATLDGEVYNELPPSFTRITDRLNAKQPRP